MMIQGRQLSKIIAAIFIIFWGIIRFTAIIILIGSGCSILEVADETANWTVEDFMNEGQAQMADSAWSGAIATYRQMLGRFPYGRYAEQAQLDIAYAYLKNSEPALAASSADQFIRMHPTHPNVDYAYYLKGLSLFEPPDGWLDVISGVNPANNDIQPVQEAFSVYQSLISRGLEDVDHSGLFLELEALNLRHTEV